MIIEIFVLLTAVPIGYFISYLTKDELKSGEKWFRVLIISSILIGILFILLGEFYISWTAGFVFIVSLISLIKANDKKWIKSKL